MMVFTRVERKDRNCRRKWQKKRAKVKKKLRDLNSSTMLHKVVMKVKRKSGNSGNTESGGEKEVNFGNVQDVLGNITASGFN